MPLPILLTFSEIHEVDAQDVINTYYRIEVLRGPCFLINLAVQNSTSLINNWDAVICKSGHENFMGSITLFQREAQRGIAMDVIWEGRRYIPQGWVLEVNALDGLNLADILHMHGGYESV